MDAAISQKPLINVTVKINVVPFGHSFCEGTFFTPVDEGSKEDQPTDEFILPENTLISPVIIFPNTYSETALQTS